MTAAVVWFEIVVTDFEQAKRFYGQLLGWQFEQLEGYDEEYWTTVGAARGINGALTGATADRRPGGGAVVYVDVDDLEGAVGRALELGARQVQGPRIITPEDGRFAIVADPDGNHLGLVSSL